MSTPPIPDEVAQRIMDLLLSGRKIEAIKVARESTGLGLKESKAYIESIEANLARQFPDQYPPKRGCTVTAALIFVAVGLLAAQAILA